MKAGFTYDIEAVETLLGLIIQRHVELNVWDWINERKTAAIGSSAFNTAFAAIPRKTGKALIQVTEGEKNQLQILRRGVTINNWSIDRLVRVWLLMHVDSSDEEKYFKSVDQLFLSAEMNELVALYSALPLLAYPEKWCKRCADGIRSNIGDVLQAIMCNNPYPSEQLDEKAWNQMVLKAFFTEKPVGEIIGLDERANAELAGILLDYAHERQAAGRAVNPLLWRCVGIFINASNFADMQRLINSDNELEKEAAALACYESDFGPVKKLLNTMPRIKSEIEKGELTWQTFAQKITH